MNNLRIELNLSICRGWKHQVQRLAATGYYHHRPHIRQAQYWLALEALSLFVTSKDDEEYKEENRRILEQHWMALNETARRFLKEGNKK